MLQEEIFYFNPLIKTVPCFNSDYDLIWLNLNESKSFMLGISEISSCDLIAKTKKYYNEVGGAREWKKYYKVLLYGVIFTIDSDYLLNL